MTKYLVTEDLLSSFINDGCPRSWQMFKSQGLEGCEELPPNGKWLTREDVLRALDNQLSLASYPDVIHGVLDELFPEPS